MSEKQFIYDTSLANRSLVCYTLFGAVILYNPGFANVLIPLEVSKIKRKKKQIKISQRFMELK